MLFLYTGFLDPARAVLPVPVLPSTFLTTRIIPPAVTALVLVVPIISMAIIPPAVLVVTVLVSVLVSFLIAIISPTVPPAAVVVAIISTTVVVITVVPGPIVSPALLSRPLVPGAVIPWSVPVAVIALARAVLVRTAGLVFVSDFTVGFISVARLLIKAPNVRISR